MVIIIEDMAMKLYILKQIWLLSLRIWLQILCILKQIRLCYLRRYGYECHLYSSNYRCVILEGIAVNGMHTQADMVVLYLRVWL